MRAVFFWIGLTVVFLTSCSKEKTEPALFESLDSVQTGITFVNRLAPITNKLSIVDYLYYYNGAGVAAGDINNDGLTDLLFISNRESNKLYLNKGDFKFEDITASAGLKSFAEWKTGVTMADVNGDGFLDIYLCAVANYMGLEGVNELYINNGNNTFTEKATEYGLNFSGFSTQSAFFDYDHDGDLDMYLLNHATHTSRSYDKVLARTLVDKDAGDYLYRNDNGKFIDASKEAGIYQAAMGYGLGITIADLNNDGWEDIYASNDFHEDDYYYVNNHDGTFSEAGKEAFRHFSRFSMGCDAADINNDGYEDVMTLDMSPDEEALEKMSLGEDPWDTFIFKKSFGYHYQFSRNALQMNNGGKTFLDWAMLSGVESTDWSWSTLMEDYNNDGRKDIFVTNGIVKRPNDLNYLKFSHEDSMLFASELTKAQLEIAIRRMPEGKAHNYLFEGDSSMVFIDRSNEWGMGKKGISNGAVYADLDNDGDLDLVTNSINESPGVFRNLSEQQVHNNFLAVSLKGDKGNTFGLGTKVYVSTKDGIQLKHLTPTRGFLSSVEPRLHFGLKKETKVDSVIVVWNDGKTQVITGVNANTSIVVDKKDAGDAPVNISLYKQSKPLFTDVTKQINNSWKHKENNYLDIYRENLMPFMVSKEGPKVAVGDVNGDGLDDMYLGGAKFQEKSLFIQSKNGFTLSKQKAFVNDSVFEDTDALFIDVDNDKDLDLYVVTGGNEFFGSMEQQDDRLYVNDGKGNFTRDMQALPPLRENKSCVRAFDYDGDNDLDLFVGGRVVGYGYGKAPKSFLLTNDGKGKFTDDTERLAPALRRAGMITDAAWADFDKDGKTDLVVVGDWMPVKIFRYDGQKFLEPTEIANTNGLWQGLSVADMDNDGDMDLVAGNIGLNTRLRKNKDQSVLTMYVGDFDKNGQREHVIAYNRPDGKIYPVATKDELAKQMPSIITKKFNDYRLFAGKTVEEIMGEGIHADSILVMHVDQFASMYFENIGGMKFTAHALPNEAQLSKTFVVLTDDFDKDGVKDILTAGNFIGGSTYQSVYDASQGNLLKGNGKGNFVALPAQASGLWLKGQVRDIEPVRTPNGVIYVVSKNGENLDFIKLQ
ncbi:MAG: VCBS repeat-containing protein [Bacteroidota bacterium]